MKSLPSITSEIDEKIIYRVIDKNFSLLAPFFYSFVSNWLIRAYKRYSDIDKFIIVIYLIHQNLVFYRKNGLIIDYESFYRDRTLEINKINISDISNIYIEEYKKNYSNIIFNSKIENNIVHNFDQSYIDIIFNNLFKNSIEALKDIKNPQIELLLSINDNKLKLIFFDNGPGYEGDVGDLLKPYFSTKNSSGLGLSLISKIVNENNGDLFIKTNKYSGFKVEICFNV